MPHFLASKFSLPPLPFKQDDFTFMYEAIACKDDKQSLILVQHKDKKFFLRKQQRSKQNDTIVKLEKSSAREPTGIVKNALKILCQKQQSIINHNLNNNSHRQNLQSPYLKTIEDFLNLAQPCIIEIGFGSGRHLLYLAQNNPHMLCIGVEIHMPSIEQILRQIQLLKLKNLYIIKSDARVFLEIFPSHKVEGIYVHFPIPWNKKPHRRVFSQKFLQESLRVLNQNGILHLRSDDEIYFKDALTLSLNEPSIKLEVLKNMHIPIVSKYEARWERQQKNIYDMKIFKQNAEKPIRNEKNIKKRFLFDKILRKNLDNYTNFPYKKIDKHWFLNINSLYRAGNDTYVLELCLGDFNQPQNAFLQVVFSNTQSVHYISNPIPTQAAIEAHSHLMNILTQE